MEMVADTNIFLAVVLDESEKSRIIQLTAGATVMAPEILPYEIGNALSAMVKRRRLCHAEALRAEHSAMQIPVRRVEIEIRAALQIALTHSIYAYDAYFLQCALALSRPLLTLDQQMQQVAREVGIQILE